MNDRKKISNSKLELQKKQKQTTPGYMYIVNHRKQIKTKTAKPKLDLQKNKKKTRPHVYSKSQEAEQNKSQLNLSLNRKKQRLASKETGKYLVQTNKQK